MKKLKRFITFFYFINLFNKIPLYENIKIYLKSKSIIEYYLNIYNYNDDINEKIYAIDKILFWYFFEQDETKALNLYNLLINEKKDGLISNIILECEKNNNLENENCKLRRKYYDSISILFLKKKEIIDKLNLNNTFNEKTKEKDKELKNKLKVYSNLFSNFIINYYTHKNYLKFHSTGVLDKVPLVFFVDSNKKNKIKKFCYQIIINGEKVN